MTQERSQALVETISHITFKQAFFASLLFDQMEIIETEEVEIAATNGRYIKLNPVFLETLTVPERAFIVCHEILHRVLEHLPRAKSWESRGIGPDFKKFSFKRANIAQDYIINDMLKNSNIGQMPTGGPLGQQIGLHDTAIATAEDVWDEVYCRIPEPEEEEDGGGEGSGGHGGFDNHDDPSGDAGANPSETELKRAIAGALQAAKSRGQMPGGLERIIGDIIEPKKDWKEILRSSITNAVGHDESTWSRLNRKKLVMPGVCMPGTTGHASTAVACVVDTSGSVSPQELDAFMGELHGILQDARPSDAKIFWTDAEVSSVETVGDDTDVQELNPTGGGGTDMEAAYPVIEDHMDTSDMVCIIFTDGYVPWNEDKQPPYQVIVVTTGDEGCPYANPEVKLELDG